MTPTVARLLEADPQYPDSDGKPMSDNTVQGRWITLIYDNLRALFAHDELVFIAADNLIYPVRVERGQTAPSQAPDVYVVFGRPRHDRGSYRYWEENNVPVTVAFEILSPRNTEDEMEQKLAFYSAHGIEEYYVYDPARIRLEVWMRGVDGLAPVWPVDGFRSQRMGIRFDLSGEELVIRHPDGRPFVLFEVERQRADAAERLAGARLRRANAAQRRANTQRQQAEAAQQQAEAAQAARLTAEQRLARVLELSRKARRGEATPEELAELDRLEAAG